LREKKTQRVYGLVGKSRVFDHIVEHPRILDLVDSLLLPNYLLATYQAIKILPGETPQPMHCDDGFFHLPRPRAPISYATIWAIDEFTAENGGTIIIPRSHKWGNEPPTKEIIDKYAVPVVMPAGSVVFFASTLWHGGGPNTSNKSRLALSAHYSQPWSRPQENLFLVVPPSDVPQLSPRLQSLIGYSIHPPFIGHACGLHPLKTLQTYKN